MRRGDVSIIVAWILPFFSSLWLIYNQSDIHNRKKPHLCQAYWGTGEIYPSIHPKVGGPEHGGGVSEWSGSKAISNRGGNCGEGSGQPSSELAQLFWQRTRRVKAQPHVLQLERPVALSEERPQWLGEKEREVAKRTEGKHLLLSAPRGKGPPIGLWDPTPNLRIPLQV